jgi:arginyl-tRNA synthetase
MEPNLFDQLEQAVNGEDKRAHWTAQAPFTDHPDFDLMLVPRVERWQEDTEARRSLRRIGEAPWAAATIATPSAVGLRLHDEWLARIASRLDSRADATACNGRPADVRHMAVYFWGANTTKALHVGHLRDLAIGNALCATLAAAGAQVERRSLIADVGRGMGEAIAGVVRAGGHLRSRDGLTEKSDHYVGRCYADYVQSRPAGPHSDGETTDSLDREVVMHDDSADEILERLLAGDTTTVELWSKTRDWVLAGHRQTLARLGISFDRVIFESDFQQKMTELGDVGLRAGLLTRREDGAAVYLTGREELEEMPLVRPDGLPTQHMRALAYWAAAPELEGMSSIQVCGSEWVAHVTCRRKLIDELALESPEVNRNHPTHTLFHGMVTEGGQRLASSQGALRLDDLLEWIETQVDRDPQGRAERDGLEQPAGLAARIALGHFLLSPTGKAVELDMADFLADGQSLGWDLARARNHVNRAADHVESPLTDPEYRFLVVRSELLRHQLRTASERLDVMPIARHASHLARWWLQHDRGACATGAMQLVLDQVERYLGLDVGR